MHAATCKRLSGALGALLAHACALTVQGSRTVPSTLPTECWRALPPPTPYTHTRTHARVPPSLPRLPHPAPLQYDGARLVKPDNLSALEQRLEALER